MFWCLAGLVLCLSGFGFALSFLVLSFVGFTFCGVLLVWCATVWVWRVHMLWVFVSFGLHLFVAFEGLGVVLLFFCFWGFCFVFICLIGFVLFIWCYCVVYGRMLFLGWDLYFAGLGVFGWLVFVLVWSAGFCLAFICFGLFALVVVGVGFGVLVCIAGVVCGFSGVCVLCFLLLGTILVFRLFCGLLRCLWFCVFSLGVGCCALG